eukprot:gene2559-2591_t
MYVDNPSIMSKTMKRCLPGLGKNLYPGDSGVKGDSFHLVTCIKDSTSGNHPSWLVAQEELRAAIRMKHGHDEQALVAGRGGNRKTARVMYKPPKQMLEGVVNWAHRWQVAGVAVCSGEPLFTFETISVLKNVMNNIVKWRYSDPWILNPADNTYTPYNMYHQAKDGSERTLRNTSATESWHSASNDVSQGSNTGEELKGRYAMQRRFKWNVDKHVQLGAVKDYGTYDYPQLLRIKKAQEKLHLNVEYGDVPDPDPNQRPAFVEAQGYEWKTVLETMPAVAKRTGLPHAAGLGTSTSHGGAAHPQEIMSDPCPRWLRYRPDQHEQPACIPLDTDWTSSEYMDYAARSKPLSIVDPARDDAAYAEFLLGDHTENQPTEEQLEEHLCEDHQDSDEEVDSEDEQQLLDSPAHSAEQQCRLTRGNEAETMSGMKRGLDEVAETEHIPNKLPNALRKAIKEVGDGRMTGTFGRHAMHGSLAAPLASINRPVTTAAEKELLMELRSKYTKSKSVDWPDMVTEWNQRYLIKYATGQAMPAADETINPKLARDFRVYNRTLGHGVSKREQTQMAAAAVNARQANINISSKPGQHSTETQTDPQP